MVNFVSPLSAVVAAVVLAVRSRFFHAFSSIPGPWTNSISELPAAWNLVRGNQHLYYQSLHEKHGPVVRVSPDELSFVSPDARHEIYGLRKGGLNMEKSPIFLGAVGNVNGQTGVSLALNADHARQRRALSFLFTNTALLRQEHLLQLHVRKFIKAWEGMEAKQQSMDVSEWYTYLAFDMMGELCFAEPFGCLDQASGTEWSTSVINVFIAATWTQGIRRIAGVGTWFEKVLTRLLVPAKAAEWRNIHLANSREKTTRRLADTNREHPDFMYHILANNESKKSLSETEIILNVALFISAGSDTVATALTGWTYFICTHPAAYARLVREVRESCASAEDVGWERIQGMAYLKASISEALRLFPPSPASQQRIVPAGGATIDGVFVPAGKTVAVPPWASKRSPLNFHESECFRPERWLEGDDKDPRYADDRLAASVPFGNGPRVCIGRNLAYFEMHLAAAHILWHFDLELDRDQHRAQNARWGLDGTLRPPPVFHSMTKPELWVKLHKVERSSS